MRGNTTERLKIRREKFATFFGPLMLGLFKFYKGWILRPMNIIAMIRDWEVPKDYVGESKQSEPPET